MEVARSGFQTRRVSVMSLEELSWLRVVRHFFNSMPEEQRGPAMDLLEQTFPAFVANELEPRRRRPLSEVRRGLVAGPSLWVTASLAERLAVRAEAYVLLQSHRDGVPTLLSYCIVELALPLHYELAPVMGEYRIDWRLRVYIDRLRVRAPERLLARLS